MKKRVLITSQSHKTLDAQLKNLDRALQGKTSKIELKAMMKTAHLILYNLMEELKE